MAVGYTAPAEEANEVKPQQPKSRRNLWIGVGVGAVLAVALVIGLSVGLTRNNSSSSGSASTSSISSNLLNCSSSYDSTVDYFPQKLNLYVPNPNFDVKYFKSYKVITNSLNPNKVETLVLYQCGTPRPNVTDVNVTHYISVPISSISVGDTTSVTYLELLGVRSSIKVTDSLQYISSPCIQAANASGVGPTSIDTYSSNVNATLSTLNTVDVALDYEDSVTAQAKNYVTFPATTDTSSYGRIAWLSFLGALFNLEEKANNVTKSLADNYNCLKGHYSTNRTTARPVVAWVDYLEAQDYTYNTTVWILDRWPVYLEYTRDAGATNITTPLSEISAKANSSIATLIGGVYYRSYFTNLTAFLEVIKDVDIIVDSTYFYTTATPEASLANFNLTVNSSQYKFIKNKAIWRQDKRVNGKGGSDWYESAVVEANMVLNDLVVIVNNLTSSTRYFRNIYNNGTDITTLTAADCGATGLDALKKPLYPDLATCSN